MAHAGLINDAWNGGQAAVTERFSSWSLSAGSPRKSKSVYWEEEWVVLQTQVLDIIEGNARLPITNKKAWINLPGDCLDLCRTHAHSAQGTCHSKKITSLKDWKHYLNVATIAWDGLLGVPGGHPIAATNHCIVALCQVLDGMLEAIQLQLSHRHAANSRPCYLFALDMAPAIHRVTEAWYQCLSLHRVSQIVVPQVSTCPLRPLVCPLQPIS